MLLVSKLNKLLFGYFDPEKYFEIIKITNFQGELTDISAKIAALMCAIHLLRIQHDEEPQCL